MKWDKFDWMMAVIIGCIMAIGVALIAAPTTLTRSSALA